MSRLEEIREGLYRKTSGEPAPAPGEELRPPTKEKEAKRAWGSSDSTPPRLLEQAYLAKRRSRLISGRFFWVIAAMALVGLLAFIGYTLFFSRAEVEFEILGSSQVTAGEPSVFILRIVNNSGVTLKDGTVTLTLPEGSLISDGGDISLRPWREKFDVTDIPNGGEFRKEIRIRFLGTLDQIQRLSGFYLYRPENISSKFTRTAEASVTIVRVPVAIAVDAPDKISSGQEFSLTIGVDAETSSPLPPLTLGVDFPTGFELQSSDPPLSGEGNNLWPMTNLESGTSTQVVLRGLLKGEPAEVKAFHIRLGRYDAASKQWLLLTELTRGPAIASPFLLAQTTLGGKRSGTIPPGARVEGNVLFKNNLPEKIQNLTVTLSFPEKVVELETVRAEGGFYDATRRALTWDSASEPRLRELDSGEEGILVFSFTLKSNLPIKNFSDKNFLLSITTAIDSRSPPPEYRGVSLAYQDSIEFKIESRLTLAARAAYYDSPRPNSGPMPPKVRSTTTYTVFWHVGSGANALRNVEVSAQLPGNVELGEVIGSDAGKVDFNPASREIIWRIGELKAATGILRPHLAAVFQVALTPADNQINYPAPILQNISATGRDVFADTELHATVEGLSTELRRDPKSTYNEWQVIP